MYQVRLITIIIPHTNIQSPIYIVSNGLRVIIMCVVFPLARVKPNGHFCIILDAKMTDIAIHILTDKHFGNIQIFPLFSTKHTAERVLIRAKQGVKTGASIYSGTNMNNESILRSGLTIDEWLATLN